MATMNKPCYQAIMTHSPDKPVLIFVSSRRQTRLTAVDLITYLVSDQQPRRFLNMTETELQQVLQKIDDPSLKHTMSFGIAMHHAGKWWWWHRYCL
jgi:activating signal cointegrator complex subunit 3